MAWVDLISGLIVVPPGQGVDIFFDLNEWTLKQGKATASISLPAYYCSEFFRDERPQPTWIKEHFGFNAPLSVEPRD